MIVQNGGIKCRFMLIKIRRRMSDSIKWKTNITYNTIKTPTINQPTKQTNKQTQDPYKRNVINQGLRISCKILKSWYQRKRL